MGCGAGKQCFSYYHALEGDADITGTDVSESLLAQAREENKKVNNAINFQQLDFNQPFDLPSDSFDLVSACFAIYYAQDIPFTLSEMHRVLKPGGRLMVSDLVLLRDLPADLKESIEAYVGCIAGALPITQYETGLGDAGFTDVTITRTITVGDAVHSAIIKATKPANG